MLSIGPRWSRGSGIHYNAAVMGDKDETALPADPSQIVEKVRDRYGRIAEGKEAGCCPTASSSCGDPAAAAAVAIGYQGRDLEAVPSGANLGLGCGAGAMPRQAYFDLVAAAGLTGVRIHKDVDYLAAGGYTFTDELQARLDESGVRLGDLAGRVRSITFEARKPRA